MNQIAHQPHVTNYRILSDQTAQRLSALVETAIYNGWQPWGPLNINGVIDTANPGDVVYSQAMVQQSEWFR